MCGLFAFTGERPDMTLLANLAVRSGRRGPHSWGYVVRQPEGLTRFVQIGNVDPLLLPLDGPLIGHARLATTGQWRDLVDAQPLMTGDRAVAHNGVISNAPALMVDLGRAPKTANDSEALLWLLASGASLADALSLAPPTRHAAVSLTMTGMEIMSTGQPMYRIIRPEGTYYASCAYPGAERIEKDAACF